MRTIGEFEIGPVRGPLSSPLPPGELERLDMKYFAMTLAACVALCAGRASSQTFKTLVEFTGTGGTASGSGPEGSLTLCGTTLYGMGSGSYYDANGQLYGDGNVFSVGINGTDYQNLVSFTGTGGSAFGLQPFGSLTLVGTTLYGMTRQGGPINKNAGNIFSVGTNGTNYQNLISFTGTSGTAIGGAPYGSLTLVGTNFYGMTELGGVHGYGSIFSVGTDGSNLRSLVSFSGAGGTLSGASPYGNLTLAGTTLYGMTFGLGSDGFGNVFSVATNGTNYQDLTQFTGTGGTKNGEIPYGSLTNSGTTLYGMTSHGGAYGYGNVFSIGTNGSYENLLSMTGGTAGYFPWGSLILSGTTLYGMTKGPGGSTYAYGNIFSVGIDSSDYQDLYNFTGGADGYFPNSDLTLSGGTLFGTTSQGGANIYYGTVLRWTSHFPYGIRRLAGGWQKAAKWSSQRSPSGVGLQVVLGG